MKKGRIIVVAVILFTVALFATWAINNYLNEKQFDEEKAALYDESMSKSFSFLTTVQSSLLAMINIYDEIADEANMVGTLYFKDAFEQKFSEKIDNSRPFFTLYYQDIRFVETYCLTAVCGYLSDGGTLRKEESAAFREFMDAWHEVYKIPNNSDYDAYDAFKERLVTLKDTIMMALPKMKRTINNYDQNIQAWREINPKDKLYIWERYNERKIGPLAF